MITRLVTLVLTWYIEINDTRDGGALTETSGIMLHNADPLVVHTAMNCLNK